MNTLRNIIFAVLGVLVVLIVLATAYVIYVIGIVIGILFLGYLIFKVRTVLQSPTEQTQES